MAVGWPGADPVSALPSPIGARTQVAETAWLDPARDLLLGLSVQVTGRSAASSPRCAAAREPDFFLLIDMSLEQFAWPRPSGVRLRGWHGADDFVAACVGQRRALFLRLCRNNRFVWRAAPSILAITALFRDGSW